MIQLSPAKPRQNVRSMLAYPHGLCVSWKLQGSLCCALDSEASSRLAEGGKAVTLTEGLTPYCVLIHRAVFQGEKHLCVTNPFFFVVVVIQEGRSFPLFFWAQISLQRDSKCGELFSSAGRKVP